MISQVRSSIAYVLNDDLIGFSSPVRSSWR